MIEIISLYFLLFLLYSFLGWSMEMVVCYISTKKLVNRGFLIGPICPIYGYGCLLMIIFLQRYLNDPIVLIVMAMMICSILEYFTSYIMEKLFKARWWDYSNKKYNINGRICLDNMLAFGLLGMLLLYVINPFVIGLLDKVEGNILLIISIILFVVYIIDNIISLKVISSFKNVAKSIKKDSTEEITKKVREILASRGKLYRRLVSAFDFQASEKLISNIKKRVKHETLKAKRILDERIEQHEETRDRIIQESKEKIKELKERIKIEKEIKKEKLKKMK